MKVHVPLLLALFLAGAGQSWAQYESCGKNGTRTMPRFLPQADPVFRLADSVGDGAKLDKDSVESMTVYGQRPKPRVLAVRPNEVDSIALEFGGTLVKFSSCEIKIPGQQKFQGFELSKDDASRVQALIRKYGVAALRIKWRTKQPGKVYIAEAA